jgi:hypothetical protein
MPDANDEPAVHHSSSVPSAHAMVLPASFPRAVRARVPVGLFCATHPPPPMSLPPGRGVGGRQPGPGEGGGDAGSALPAICGLDRRGGSRHGPPPLSATLRPGSPPASAPHGSPFLSDARAGRIRGWVREALRTRQPFGTLRWDMARIRRGTVGPPHCQGRRTAPARWRARLPQGGYAKALWAKSPFPRSRRVCDRQSSDSVSVGYIGI